jgi:hypothetical protein
MIKYLILVCFISFNSFAGDLYLVCETEEEAYVNVSIDNGFARSVFLYENTVFDISVKENHLSEFTMFIKVLHPQNGIDIKFPIEIHEDFKLDDYLSCAIRD